MASVSMKAVEKNFGHVPVLRGIDIDIRDGEFAVFVGPSGCGKSTLLRLLAGLDEPSAGQICIGERVVNDLSPRERNIAMVFQSYALFPHMTVAENIGFGLKLARTPAELLKSKVKAAAQTLSLDTLLDRTPRQLSGGQRQRVAMGRAMVRDPDVFLFDEPLSNLDAKLRVQMRAEIRALHQRIGTTSIYVTHDQIEAMTMADRIVVLRDGMVQQTGTPAELYDRPIDVFVAAFIGSPSMNLIPARWQAGAVALGDGSLVAAATSAAPEAALHIPDQTITYGLRPEHIQLVDPQTPGALRATIEVVEFSGADTLLVGRCEMQAVHALLRQRVTLKPGTQVGLMPSQAAHVFDEQGQRIGGY